MIYSAESYLDDCLRLRGGIAPDEHTNRAVREVLSDLAAARREVETVTKEREEIAEALKRAMDDTADWRKRLEWARDAVQGIDAMMADAGRRNTIEHGVGPVEAVRSLLSDLATSRAALEDVRRTITREEAGQAQLLLDRVATGTVGLQAALPLLAAAWRLTVEDA